MVRNEAAFHAHIQTRCWCLQSVCQLLRHADADTLLAMRINMLRSFLASIWSIVGLAHKKAIAAADYRSDTQAVDMQDLIRHVLATSVYADRRLSVTQPPFCACLLMKCVCVCMSRAYAQTVQVKEPGTSERLRRAMTAFRWRLLQCFSALPLQLATSNPEIKRQWTKTCVEHVDGNTGLVTRRSRSV